MILPGDRVSITGIYRAGSIRLNHNRRNVKSVYRTHIDAIHFQKGNSKGVKRQEEGSAFSLTAEREAEIKEISTRPDIYESLAESLAPSIFGNEDIKKGILLQLIGASEKDLDESGRGKVRSEIHVLLCGDPGTSKSQLLSAVNRLVWSHYARKKSTKIFKMKLPYKTHCNHPTKDSFPVDSILLEKARQPWVWQRMLRRIWTRSNLFCNQVLWFCLTTASVALTSSTKWVRRRALSYTR